MKNKAIYDIKDKKVLIDYKDEVVELTKSKQDRINTFWDEQIKEKPYFFRGDLVTAIDLKEDEENKLKKILDDINLKYKADIKANFLITLGDEFQGLLNSPVFAIEIVKYIQRELYPVKLRFGIGIGEISTEINQKAAVGADGPALFAAREMIDFLRNQ